MRCGHRHHHTAEHIANIFRFNRSNVAQRGITNVIGCTHERVPTYASLQKGSITCLRNSHRTVRMTSLSVRYITWQRFQRSQYFRRILHGQSVQLTRIGGAWQCSDDHQLTASQSTFRTRTSGFNTAAADGARRRIYCRCSSRTHPCREQRRPLFDSIRPRISRCWLSFKLIAASGQFASAGEPFIAAWPRRSCSSVASRVRRAILDPA
jgi:hypothetical protein